MPRLHGTRKFPPAPRAGTRSWLVPLAIAAACLVGLVWLALTAGLLLRRRRSAATDDLLPTEESPAAPDENAVAAEALALAADESPAELRIEGDARRAIIACYAQMERSLARAGKARRPSEAPFEYLARVLVSVAPAGGRVLTDLYERAMFSTQPLSDRDRDRAVEALEALRHATFA